MIGDVASVLLIAIVINQLSSQVDCSLASNSSTNQSHGNQNPCRWLCSGNVINSTIVDLFLVQSLAKDEMIWLLIDVATTASHRQKHSKTKSNRECLIRFLNKINRKSIVRLCSRQNNKTGIPPIQCGDTESISQMFKEQMKDGTTIKRINQSQSFDEINIIDNHNLIRQFNKIFNNNDDNDDHSRQFFKGLFGCPKKRQKRRKILKGTHPILSVSTIQEHNNNSNNNTGNGLDTTAGTSLSFHRSNFHPPLGAKPMAPITDHHRLKHNTKSRFLVTQFPFKHNSPDRRGFHTISTRKEDAEKKSRSSRKVNMGAILASTLCGAALLIIAGCILFLNYGSLKSWCCGGGKDKSDKKGDINADSSKTQGSKQGPVIKSTDEHGNPHGKLAMHFAKIKAAKNQKTAKKSKKTKKSKSKSKSKNGGGTTTANSTTKATSTRVLDFSKTHSSSRKTKPSESASVKPSSEANSARHDGPSTKITVSNATS